ncbi:MAG: hypothetical protein Q7O12_04685 [Deltaproteobacteria bacterium]|nr:hypothetical protein [Deltaproteobacteria bacterium]
MFNRFKKWRKEHQKKRFLVSEARRCMQELGISKHKSSDKAVIAICVGIGVGQLAAMCLAKSLGEDAVIQSFIAPVKPAQHLDG